MNTPEPVATDPLRLPANQPLRQAVRRLRWFRSTFDARLRAISSETGITYAIDTQKLTQCFVAWLRAFEAQKPERADERRAYVGFAAGLMLRQLILDRPVTVEALPDDADPDKPAAFWPEGYLYLMYCLTIRQAILKEDFHQEIAFSPALEEIRTWWSFKENVDDDPSLAIGFLDLFAGDEPNWSMPTIFEARAAQPTVIGSAPFPLKTITKG